jgi:hypothetical protein
MQSRAIQYDRISPFHSPPPKKQVPKRGQDHLFFFFLDFADVPFRFPLGFTFFVLDDTLLFGCLRFDDSVEIVLRLASNTTVLIIKVPLLRLLTVSVKPTASIFFACAM